MDKAWHIPQRCGQAAQVVVRTVESSTGSGRYSVYVNLPKQSYDCTCPGFRFHGRCKHVEVVKSGVCAWTSDSSVPQSLQQNVGCVCPACGGETDLAEVRAA